MSKVQVRVLRPVRRTPVGGVLTLTKREAAVLEAAGRVEKIVETEVAPTLTAERAVVEAEPAADVEAAEMLPRPRRQYQRRDMQAEGTTARAPRKAVTKRAPRKTAQKD